MGQKLLTVGAAQAEYRLGRNLTRQLCHLLPHLKVGPQRIFVFRNDIEKLLHQAAAESLSLWDIAEWERKKLHDWLDLDTHFPAESA